MNEENNQNNLNLVIIGAGMAGLRAGLTIHDNKIDSKWKIIEARERIGGRVFSPNINVNSHQFILDLGAGWIGEDHNELYSLVKRFSLENKLILQVEKGKNILRLDSNKKQKEYSGIIPPFPILELLSYEWNKRGIDKLVSTVNINDIYSTPNAQKLDKITFQEYLEQQFGNRPNLLTLVKKGLETSFGCDFAQTSLLFVLFYIKSSNNLDYLVESKGGAQQHKLDGGMQQIPNKMADEIGYDKIELRKEVVEIVKSGNQNYDIVTKDLENGGQIKVYKTQCIIFSIPPRVLKDVKFTNITLCKQIKTQMEYEVCGNLLKCWVVYKSAFWVEKKMSGMALTPDEFITVTYDCSSCGYAMLMGFISGKKAEAFIKKSKQERQDIVISSLVKSFGEEAKNFIYYTENEFYNSPYTKGCPVGVLKPGAYEQINLSKENNESADPNIHFIGTEFSDKYNGYMEGAALSGKKIIQKLFNLKEELLLNQSQKGSYCQIY